MVVACQTSWEAVKYQKLEEVELPVGLVFAKKVQRKVNSEAALFPEVPWDKETEDGPPDLEEFSLLEVQPVAVEHCHLESVEDLA